MKLYTTLVAGVSFCVMAVILGLGTVSRYVLKKPVVGVEDVAELALLLTVYCVLPELGKEERHVKVTFLIDKMKGATKRALMLFSYCIVLLTTLGITAGFIVRTCRLALGIGIPEVTDNLHVPIWPFLALSSLGLVGLGAYTLLKMMQFCKFKTMHTNKS